MRGAFIPVFVAGITPILVLALIAGGLAFGWVEWQPSVMWTVQLGNVQEKSAVDAVTTYGPSVFATGHVGDYQAFYHGYPTYLFLDKYDQNGKVLWSKQFGSAGTNDYVGGVAVAANTIYLAVSLNDSSFLRNYDMSGNQIWTVKIPNLPSSESISIGTDHVYVTGTNGFSAYDLNGNLLWAKNATGTHIFANSQAVYVGGDDHVQKYDTSGAPQWTYSSSLYGISGDATGIYVATLDFQPRVTPVFLYKLDSNGKVLWASSIPAPDGQSVQQTPTVFADSSGIYVTVNQFVMKYDSNGNRAWFVQPAGRFSSFDAIAAAQDGVYVGSCCADAYLFKVGMSSSLILFGVNPPYSFIIVAILGGVVASSIFWLRKHRRKRLHPGSADVMRYGRPKDSRTQKKFILVPKSNTILKMSAQ